ncbi:histidine phosphatase family protein [Lactobacillus sp. ESL0791]|uniref:histidine phosphatase family protein n=1 Tax=Lactobacillus sp. ESL0791 TaxID=2983234 RepID=UPI0023F7D4AA|nr:histidine phosphatase family protein [Lactobacillus sp. ESL0791]MDF7639473.1 histidine phosphatase family protein [Lactobacillus sp. ESL0791]
MLNVYIVRHGETDTNKSHSINGASMNLPLNETGVKQVELLRDSFDTSKIDYVYASPLKRAQETAEILDQGRHQIITDNRLTEMNYGDWDGKTSDEIYNVYPQVFDDLGFFKENYNDYCNGESFQHLAERVMSFWHELLQKHVNQSVLLVFHGTASRTMVQNVLQIPDMSMVTEVDNAGVVNFVVNDKTKYPTLLYYNRVAPGKFFIE